MTNGERFREIFKNVLCGISNDKKFINVWYIEDGYCIIPIEWWNAEYIEPSNSEKPNKSEIPTSTTTKNDLGVDAISKQAVLNKILKFSVTDGRSVSVTSLWTEVNELPSVTPQEPRWISVNEKLPNDRDWYLGIFKEPDTGWINPLPFICDYVGRETKATTKEHWILRGFTDRDEHIDYYFNLECVAWMPLSEPYREEEK